MEKSRAFNGLLTVKYI